MSDASDLDAATLRALTADRASRVELWAGFLNHISARTVVEVGVFRGLFAAEILGRCASIETYYMIDPWRHLEDWNKPANRDDAAFDRLYEEALDRTADHASRRVVLRGRTTEVVDRIPDAGVDFAYIDGDHTLRGIAIDLIRMHPKVRLGGWIAGDDFSPSIWQHGPRFEPTLVFPFAVHFAEAVGAPIYGLPHRQFLLHKQPDGRFGFVDLPGRYARLGLLAQLTRPDAPSARPTPVVRAMRKLRRAARLG